MDPTSNVNDTKGPVYHGNREKEPEIQGQRIEIQRQKKELQDLKTSIEINSSDLKNEINDLKNMILSFNKIDRASSLLVIIPCN